MGKIKRKMGKKRKMIRRSLPNIWQSYGAQLCIITYLPGLQVLSL